MKHYAVVPECYADTLLIEMLGFDRTKHVLNMNLSKVVDAVIEAPGKSLVGIIDDDKNKGKKALADFEQIDQKHQIKKWVSNTKTILIISPAFERWLFANAEWVNVDPAKYGFQDWKSLKDAAKRIDADQNSRLKAFINTLIQKKAPGLVLLKAWILEALEMGEEDLY